MISIYGGGFSGVTLAWELIKKGKPVTIYEKSDRLGGQIQTIEHEGLRHERAANAFLSTPEVRALFAEIELEFEEVKETGKRKYIFREGLKTWPLGMVETVQFIFSLFIAIGTRNLKPKKQETVAHWGRRCLGKAATQYLLAPALTGIYAGNIETMSASLVIGGLFKKKSKSQGSIRPRGGMSEFFRKIEEKLKHNGCKIIFNSQVDFSEIESPKIFTAGLAEAEKIIDKTFKLQSVAKMTLQFENPIPCKPGFGVLLPEEFSKRVLGVLFDSNIFQEHSYAETWILGGARWPEIKDVSDSELIDVVLEERQKLFSLKEKPQRVISTLWQRGIPDYNLDLEEEILKGGFSKNNFHGNYLGDIGLSRIFERSVRLSEKF